MPAGPEFVPGEVLRLSLDILRDPNRAFALDEADHLGNRRFRRDRDQHVHMIGRYGDPLGGEPEDFAPPRSRKERLSWVEAHVSYTGIGCLIWPYTCGERGYPSAVTKEARGERILATRLMCELAHGSAPTPEHQAAHSCHNGHIGCIHPQHLHWATDAENRAESVALRRDEAIRGEKRAPRSSAKKMTVYGIESAEIREKRYEIPDGLLPSFYLSVMPSGHKSFCVRFRVKGVPKRLGLGSYPQVTLETARKAAREALGKVALGSDPSAEKKTSRRPDTVSGAPQTIDQLVERFMARHVRKTLKPNTITSYEHILTKVVLPAWRGRDIGSIRRANAIALLDEIADEKPILANRALAVIASMFSWAVDKQIMESSPVVRLKKPSEEKERQRVLTDVELRLLLDVTDKLSVMGRDFIRLLILTMQRRNEIAHAKWSWVDLEACTLTIPAESAKNGCEHRLPLSSTAMAILRDRRQDATGPYVFQCGEHPFTGFARLKIEIDRLMGPMEKGWTFHDLKRTGASLMPKLGIRLPVTERVLNHVSGSFKGIVGTYQIYEYEPEMRDALEKLAAHVAKIQADNVIDIDFRERQIRK